MKKNLLLGALLITGASTVQAQTFDWAATFGGPDYAAGKTIAADANGNVYSAGYFYGTSDFDPSLGVLNFTSPSPSNQDIYVSKLDANANLVWGKHIGGNGYDDARAMVVNPANGEVYVTGWFSDTVDFDPGAGTVELMSPGMDAMFVLKLDAAGNFVWVKSLTGGGSNGFAMDFDASGNLVVGGEFNGTVDFDPGAGIQNATAAALNDAFVLVLDPSGNYVLDFQFGGTGYDEIFGLDVDPSGNIYVTGGFDGTTDLDPGVAATTYIADGYDIFVSKLNSSGNLVWGQHMGGTGDELGASIGADGSGNVYTTGRFRGTVDFDPGSGSTAYAADGFSDAFLTRLDASGNLIWAVKVGGPGLDEGTALTLAADGGIVWTGGFQDTIDIEIGSGVTNLYNEAGTDIFVAKFNNNASLAWAKNMGGSGTDWGYAVALDANENVYLTGQFTNDCDFDPNAGTATLNSLGQNDIYVMKLSLPTGIVEQSVVEQGILIHPNPASSLLQITSDHPAQLAIVNAMGQEINRLLVDSQTVIDVSTYAAGIYFVRDLSNGDAVRFLKQ